MRDNDDNTLLRLVNIRKATIKGAALEDDFRRELGYLLGRISRLNRNVMRIDSALVQSFSQRNTYFVNALSVYIDAERSSLHSLELDSLTSLAISLEPRLVDICEQAAELSDQTKGLMPLHIVLLELQSHFLGYLALFTKMRWMT